MPAHNCDVEAKLDHHRLGELAALLDEHLLLCVGRGVTDDVRAAAEFFERTDPTGYKLRYAHGLPKQGFADSFPRPVPVHRTELDTIERAVLSMLDHGELAMLTAVRPIHEDGTECLDDGFALPVRVRQGATKP